VIPDRDWLEVEVQKVQSRFGENVPLPPHWGGFILAPVAYEFWQGRQNRLHDRIRYLLRPGGKWTVERLAP
jgi:pyridoxamine 5'-phosphate oxidase